jgi:ATP-dependent RNA helicase DeaD
LLTLAMPPLTCQVARALVLQRLIKGELNVVVTTEVAARGIDIPSLTHVVNLDLPSSPQHYVHRAGRCGRAGRPGIVLSFSPIQTAFVMEKFSKQLCINVERVDIAHNRLVVYDAEQLDAPRKDPEP